MSTGGDVSDSLEAAAEISLIEGILERTRWLDEGDVAVAYHVEVGFHKQITVVLVAPAGANYDLDLHGRYQSLEENSTNPERETDSVEWLSAGSFLGGSSDYSYLNVRRVSGRSQYSLSMSVKETIVHDDMGTGATEVVYERLSL